LIFFGLWSYSIKSQSIPESVNYINYTITDGLPSNETYDIFQDSKGYLWIGTDNGVVKYDGHTFKTYTTKDGLTDNTIFRIYEDYKGRIWFITFNRKLCYLENNSIKTFQYNNQLTEATKQIPVSSIITNLQINQSNHLELILYDFTTIHIDDLGQISITETPNNKFQRYRVFKSIEDIDSCVIDIEQELWNTPSQKKIIFHSILLDISIHIITDDSNVFCSFNNGLYIISRNDYSSFKFILKQFQITGVSNDFEGGLWCSTLQDGIIYIPNPNLSIYKLPVEKTKSIHGIIPQKDFLLFNYKIRNTNFKTNKENTDLIISNEIIELNNIPKSDLEKGIKFENPININNFLYPISSLVQIDKSKTISYNYLTGFNILTYENPSKFPKTNSDYFQHVFKKVRLPPRLAFKYKDRSTDIKIVTHDEYDNIWFAYNKKSYAQMDSYPYIINRWLKKFNTKVNKLYKDSNGHVWVGTIDGLYEFDINSESLQKKTIGNLPFVRVQDIIESDDGSLFIATKANGIFIKKHDTITSITLDSGLISNTINQMIYDSSSNQIWIASNMGLGVLKYKKNKWVPKSIITKHDGLKSADIKLIRFHDDILYFTTKKTIGRIHKSNLDLSIPYSILNISSFKANETFINFDSSISLPYDSNNIRVAYQTISYKSQNDIKYQYQLLPINEKWQNTLNNNLIFEALPPDDYTLKIKAINIDNVETEIKTIQFSIVPAFWMTWWFKVIVIIVAIFIGYRISIRTINTYKNRAKLQHSLNEMQMISLQSQMNPHFIFNSLNSIQNYILKNEKTNANQYLLDFSKLIRTVLQNSSSSTIILEQELETLKMYIGLEKKRIRKDFLFQINIDSYIDQEKCIIPSLLIQPYIENSIWHGKVYNNPNGHIKLKIKLKNETLFFTILDNGIGIKNAEASKIIKSQSEHTSLGTSVTKKRIELLSELNDKMSEIIMSEVDYNHGSFVGTKIEFNIPYVLKTQNN
jgi:ligand-binding sensor domain-containing protein